MRDKIDKINIHEILHSINLFI